MPTRHHRRVSGTVRRLPSGRWQARYTGPDGAQRAVGVYPTKAEADQALAFEISEIARGTWRDPRRGDQPLADFLRTWIATRADLAPSTRALYERMFAQWIDADVPLGDLSRSVSRTTVRLGDRTLSSITPADIREWDAAVLAEARRRAGRRWQKASTTPDRINQAIRAWAVEEGRPVAPTGRMPAALREAWLAATRGAVPLDPRAERHNLGHTEAAQAYRFLHTGMAQAVSDGLILANPCAVKGASQRDARHRSERRVLSADELWALADAMPERYRAAVVVAFLSGLRAGELFALQRRHVDLTKGTLRVEQALALPGSGSVFSTTKSRAGVRAVVLPSVAVEVLAEHMALFTPAGRDALVFGTSSGRPVSNGHRSMMFGRARKAIGRDDLTWHDLRHSALTLVASTGATLPELMERAGHSTPRAALHYQHAADDSQRRIADRLDGVLTRNGERRPVRTT